MSTWSLAFKHIAYAYLGYATTDECNMDIVLD